MLRYVVLLALVAYCIASRLPVDEQRPLDGRIVGGANADIISFPWQASLQKNGQHSCGAIIYSQKIIITAAHCLYATTPSSLKIRVGSSTWISGGVVVQVAALKIHEKYNEDTVANDIAVLRLEKPLTFNSAIRPISLATQEPTDGASAVVSGWGTISSGATTIPSVLRYVNVNMISSKLCASDAFDYGDVIQTNMICAAADGKDSCQDDSGGPLVSGGELVGVVSFGGGCAEAMYPGVYANVAVLREWIENAANTV